MLSNINVCEVLYTVYWEGLHVSKDCDSVVLRNLFF